MTEILSNQYFLMVVSLVLGLGCVRFIQLHDKHEHEPFGTLFGVALVGGGVSILTCLFLYDLVYLLVEQKSKDPLQAILVIGPVEELAKLVTLFVFYQAVHKQVNEPVDGMVYMACIALGFSLVESYFYATKTPDSYDLIVWRLFLSTPTHITDSIPMGLAFYVWVQRPHRWGLLVLTWLYASLIHGLFDAGVYIEGDWGTLLFWGSMSVSLAIGIGVVDFATALSLFRPTFKEYIASVGQPGIKGGIPCEHCGDKQDKKFYDHRYFDFCQCSACGKFLLEGAQLDRVYQYFASTGFGGKKTWTRKIDYFSLQALHDLLEQARKDHIETYTGRFLPVRWFYPKKNSRRL